MEKQKKSSFSGSIGFVLAAAGSAVGLGNIWRFPYLAAKHGGGLFILVYVVLVLLFGFALLLTDVAIGRKTGLNGANAYGAMNKKFRFVGHLTFLVPSLILTYYVVIGGWILKYVTTYFTFNGAEAAADGYFNSFISSPVSPVVFMLIYLVLTAIIVFMGVEKGIEKFSKIVMPGLLLLVIGIAIYSVTLTHTTADGVVRTGVEGMAIYFIPDFSGLTVNRFINIVLDAMTQMFYSLSVAMGIMITYGSYLKKDVSLNSSVTQIQLFDTAVAILSGLMIVPAVYVFSGVDAMGQGASLMFVSLPKVFNAMGPVGNVVAIAFFVMVAFAALTSSVSIMETIVATIMETKGYSRKKTSLVVGVVAFAAAVVICMGYNVLKFNVTLPNGASGQLLDVVDYISNSVIMPFICLMTCIIVGYVVKPKWITDEVELGGHSFKRKGLYVIIVKYIGPVVMLVLLLRALGLV